MSISITVNTEPISNYYGGTETTGFPIIGIPIVVLSILSIIFIAISKLRQSYTPPP